MCPPLCPFSVISGHSMQHQLLAANVHFHDAKPGAATQAAREVHGVPRCVPTVSFQLHAALTPGRQCPLP